MRKVTEAHDVKNYMFTLMPQSYSGPPGLWLALIIKPPFACKMKWHIMMVFFNEFPF